MTRLIYKQHIPQDTISIENIYKPIFKENVRIDEITGKAIQNKQFETIPQKMFITSKNPLFKKYAISIISYFLETVTTQPGEVI